MLPTPPQRLKDVLDAFGLLDGDTSVAPFGNGNINETYLVDDGTKKIILQRLSSIVFPDPEVVAANFTVVTRHINDATKRTGIPFICAQPVCTDSGDISFLDDTGNCWRGQSYLEHIPAVEIGVQMDSAVQLGRVLAHFHLLTEDLDIGMLGDPLPGFHITSGYLKQFDQVHAQWLGKTSAELNRCLNYVGTYRSFADILETAKRKGLIHGRTVHGDPKLDNIIFTGQGSASGLFDLDTTGPGLIHYDLGDCLRSCCNRAGESGDGNEEVRFDLDICEVVLQGYFQAAGPSFSDWDRFFIYDSVRIITFELGLRFLTDYLGGNLYFKVKSPKENLWRALRQFQLLDSVIRQEADMKQMITSLTEV